MMKFDKNEKNAEFAKIHETKIKDSYALPLPYVSVFAECSEDQYIVCEPEISGYLKKLKNRIADYLISSDLLNRFCETTKNNGPDRINSELFNSEFSSELFSSEPCKSDCRDTDCRILEFSVLKVLDDYGIKLSSDRKNILLYFLFRDFLGSGKIEPVLADPLIEDISCNGYGLPVYVHHRLYGNLRTNISFNADELDSLVRRFAGSAGKSLTIASPLADATLPDGSRAQLSLGNEITTKGSTFTIRRFTERPFLPEDLVRLGTFPPIVMAYLRLAVESNMNLMFAGGTASGKTTAVNAVSHFIPLKRKIVSIEDTREISLPHLNWIPGATRQPVVMDSGTGDNSGLAGHGSLYGEVSLYDLLKTAMRQRPEYIIVGEVRGSEAYVLFQAMATGHATLSTIHAESVDRLIHRLENPPMSVPRSMVQVLDILVILGTVRINGKFVKKCLSVHEIVRVDPRTEEVVINDVYSFEKIDELNAEDFFSHSGIIARIGSRTGRNPGQLFDEFTSYVKDFEKASQDSNVPMTADDFLKMSVLRENPDNARIRQMQEIRPAPEIRQNREIMQNPGMKKIKGDANEF